MKQHAHRRDLTCFRQQLLEPGLCWTDPPPTQYTDTPSHLLAQLHGGPSVVKTVLTVKIFHAIFPKYFSFL